MRFWRIEICHITDIYEKQKDYSVLKNEEKYMIEKVYDVGVKRVCKNYLISYIVP